MGRRILNRVSTYVGNEWVLSYEESKLHEPACKYLGHGLSYASPKFVHAQSRGIGKEVQLHRVPQIAVAPTPRPRPRVGRDVVRISGILFLLLQLCFSIVGCRFTSHSFNHGKLLNPGERSTTTGFGWKSTSRVEREEEYVYSEGSGYYRNTYSKDTVSINWFAFSVDTRLGLTSRVPFGNGVEVGFHLEEAARKEEHLLMEGIPIIELSARFGLPDLELNRSILQHNIETGWIIGAWVDNGWFLGYHAGFEFRDVVPYVGIRGQITPTSVENVDFDDDYFNTHERKLLARITSGISLRMPEVPVFPDLFIPEITFITPYDSIDRKYGFTIQLGLSWTDGF